MEKMDRKYFRDYQPQDFNKTYDLNIKEQILRKWLSALSPDYVSSVRFFGKGNAFINLKHQSLAYKAIVQSEKSTAPAPALPDTTITIKETSKKTNLRLKKPAALPEDIHEAELAKCHTLFGNKHTSKLSINCD